MSSSRLFSSSLLVSALCVYAHPATAHIRLTDPIARYEITGADTGIKGCPCGLATGGGADNRRCNVEQDGSDPARNDERASTFVAGSTIVLKFDEYVGHGGRYRVAFDDDGADFNDFNAHVLLDQTDPNGSNGNVGNGKWELEVTLPGMACDNCTLQLTQVMDVDTETPVDGSKLASESTYYTCIDLKLTAPEGNTTNDQSSDTGSDAGSSQPESTQPVMSDDTTSTDVTSTTTSTTSATTTMPPSSAPEDGTADDTNDNSQPDIATTTTAVAPAVPSSAATSTFAGTTTATTTTPTTSSMTTTTPDVDEPDESGCNVTLHTKPSNGVFAALGLALCGLFVRRQRRRG